MQGQLEKTEKTERVYVKVTSDFDATGYMLPRTIIWHDHLDGRPHIQD